MRRLALCAGLAACAPHASGHHSVLPFDGARGVTLTGTVAGVVWQNPHVYLYLDVPRAGGEVQRWTVESEGAGVLRRLGWDERDLAAGDTLVVVGAPARDGSASLRCKEIALGGGRRLPCFPAP